MSKCIKRMSDYNFYSDGWLSSDNKVVVFGGTGGLGRGLCTSLSGEYDVVKVGSADVNITDPVAVSTFLKDLNPDIIINMSGYNYNSFLHKYDNYDDLEKMIEVNIYGNIHILCNALPLMREKGYGRIILASSVLSKKTMVGTSIYSASKSFVDTLARVSAVENASKNVTVNTIRMGYFDGGLTYKMPEKTRGDILAQIPARSFGDPKELYNLIKCIIDNKYINGSNIDINGGLNGI